MPDLTRRGGLWAAAQTQGLRRTTDRVDDNEKSVVVPNRKTLRAKGIGLVRRVTTSPFGRLTRSRLSPPSIDTLVAIHQKMGDGRTRKIVVPRERVDGIDQKRIFDVTS